MCAACKAFFGLNTGVMRYPKDAKTLEVSLQVFVLLSKTNAYFMLLSPSIILENELTLQEVDQSTKD
jgi:hypothetical protein